MRKPEGKSNISQDVRDPIEPFKNLFQTCFRQHTFRDAIEWSPRQLLLVSAASYVRFVIDRFGGKHAVFIMSKKWKVSKTRVTRYIIYYNTILKSSFIRFCAASHESRRYTRNRVRDRLWGFRIVWIVLCDQAICEYPKRIFSPSQGIFYFTSVSYRTTFHANDFTNIGTTIYFVIVAVSATDISVKRTITYSISVPSSLDRLYSGSVFLEREFSTVYTVLVNFRFQRHPDIRVRYA